jgi:acyl-CoA synthetase (AMP-forming)/AMP-acid ligase II
MKVNPASWMQMITKYRACVAVVKSRDLHWGLLATKDHKDVNLSSLRMLLVADGAKSLVSQLMRPILISIPTEGAASGRHMPLRQLQRGTHGLRQATGEGRSERDGARGALHARLELRGGRVDQENSLTSLTLQDCGQVMPGCVIVVVKMEGPTYLCKTDEVGEICVNSGATGTQYWGLQGTLRTKRKSGQKLKRTFCCRA